MKTIATPLLLCLTFLGCTTEAAPPAARVWFAEPKDGATVASPVKFVFKVEGMDLVPAGERAGDKKAGHHHVIVDGGPIKAGTVIIMDDPMKLHYGKAQTQAEIELKPGKHTMTLQYADAIHTSYGKDMAATITIEVTK